jgi:starch-binding outer membrane protein, SusD/RagB family
MSSIKTTARKGGPLALAWSAALIVASCDLGIENPGLIDDDALNDMRAIEPLVNGMGGDLQVVLDDISYFMGIASRDVRHTGAFEAEEFMERGEIIPRHVNDLWGGMHQARWTAEHGIPRMREVMGSEFDTSPHAIRAYLWVGFANRVLGENVCEAIIDGGAPQPHTVHFERAEAAFTEAIRLAELQNNTALARVAYGGRAQARAALAKWADAAIDAVQVPTSMSHTMPYAASPARENNWVAYQSITRHYFSVHGSWAQSVNDPRVPWTDLQRVAVDGRTPMLQQRKYTGTGAFIELVGGDEMRLIEAEALLRLGNNVAGTLSKIDEVRAAANVPPSSASTIAEAFAVLRTERDIVLWLEGRRLWDLRRFEDPFLADRDECIPASENERNTNPNLASG